MERIKRIISTQKEFDIKSYNIGGSIDVYDFKRKFVFNRKILLEKCKIPNISVFAPYFNLSRDEFDNK